MIAGTFILTDSIDNAFNSIFTDVRKGSNVVVSGKPAFELGDQSGVIRADRQRDAAPEGARAARRRTGGREASTARLS